jgi:hypothetical protein
MSLFLNFSPVTMRFLLNTGPTEEAVLAELILSAMLVVYFFLNGP